MTYPADGLFYATEKPFRFSWPLSGKPGSAYRLEPVTDLPGTLKVPAPADRLFTPSNLPSTLILVSERGGGQSYFLEWLLQENSAWKRVSLTDAYAMLNAWMKKHSEPSALSTTGLRLIIDRTRTEEFEVSDVGRKLGTVASILEDPAWARSGSKVICATRDIRNLKVDRVYSSLLSRGTACRLPHFSWPELTTWTSELLKKHGLTTEKEGNNELAKEVKRWVGGQPALTHFFYRFVDDRLVAQSTGSLTGLFQEAGAYLRNHRPHIVDRWALDLRRLLEMPPLQHRLATYASGDTKDPAGGDFDQEDAYLFLAGWVGLNPDNRWGIRSRCHQHWAREILRG